MHGHVRHSGGAPVSGATVTLIDVSGRLAGRDRTGPDGSFGIAVPARGTYTLIAIADGREPHASAVYVGDRPTARDVTLAGAGGLAGTVRAAGTGAPLAVATVTLLGGGGEVIAAGTTDSSGRYQFAEIGPGPCTLAVSAPSCQPAAVPVTITAGTVTAQDVELAAQARLEGIARTVSGAAVPDARVMLIDPDGNAVAVTTTGPDGTYEISNLARGEYTVIASGYPPVAGKLTIAAGKPHYYEVQLGHPDA